MPSDKNNGMNDIRCDLEYEFACRFPRLKTCEDYFCHYEGICNIGVQKNGNRKCNTIFEKQRENHRPHKPIKVNSYKEAVEICSEKNGHVAFFLNRAEFNEFKTRSDRDPNVYEYLGTQ